MIRATVPPSGLLNHHSATNIRQAPFPAGRHRIRTRPARQHRLPQRQRRACHVQICLSIADSRCVAYRRARATATMSTPPGYGLPGARWPAPVLRMEESRRLAERSLVHVCSGGTAPACDASAAALEHRPLGAPTPAATPRPRRSESPAHMCVVRRLGTARAARRAANGSKVLCPGGWG